MKKKLKCALVIDNGCGKTIDEIDCGFENTSLVSERKVGIME